MIMNTITKIAFAVTVVGLCTFAGCKKADAPGSDIASQLGADTSAIEKVFESAPAEIKGEFDQAIAAVKAGELKTAVSKFEALAANAKLSSDQQQSVKDFLAKIQTSLTESVGQAAEKAAEGAEKAVGDLKDTIKK